MSNITLSANAGGTGIFTIASPSSNTNRTLTLPDVTGTFNVSGAATEVPAGSASTPSIYPTGDTNTGMFFPAADTIAFTEGGTEVVRIDSSGNLNLATSGSALQWSNASNNCYIAASSGDLQFATGTAGFTERARITSSGDLLVGTTTTSTPTTSTADVYLGGIIMPPSRRTTASAANVNIDPTSGIFARSTSSLKYKRDVQDAVHGLTKVLALRPVTYKGKSEADGDTVFGGLIAEEVHNAGLPEFVQYAGDGSPDSLAYGNMVSLCIKAIQEQQALIQSLTQRIAALEGAA